MDLRFRRRHRAHQHVEVAALVGLGDVIGVDRAETALELALGRCPGGTAGGKDLVGDVQMQAAAVDIDEPGDLEALY